jgi:omega-6 fatty acid desaturase (delta-12 desaturase)
METFLDTPTDVSGPARDLLRRYAAADSHAAAFQLFTSVLPYLAVWAAAIACLLSGNAWALAAGVALALANGLLFTRLFVLQHDCGHHNFFPTKRMNNFFGNLLSVFTLTPLYNWRREHNLHHAQTGNLDHAEGADFWTMTVSEYRAAGSGKRWAYRIYRSPVVLFIIGPLLYLTLRRRFPVNLPRHLKRERRNVHWTNLLIWLLGPTRFALLTVPTIVVGASICVLGFYAQHIYEGSYWVRGDEWDFRTAALSGSSYLDLPRWMHWATANIAVHHIHHLDSRIPNYNLQWCMRENPQLKPGKSLRFTDMLRTTSLKLWCEETHNFVGYPA